MVPSDGVVGGVQVEVGQVADEAVGPAGAGQAALLAGHELQRAVGAEVQHGIGLEVLAQVAVEGREGVRGGEALLEQQAHRVAFEAHAGLHAHQHVAELRAQHEDRAAVAQLPSGRRAPLRFDLAQPGFAAHVVVDGDPGMHVRVGAQLLRVAVDDGLAQGVRTLGQRHVVAARLQARQGLEQALEDRQVGGGAGVAGIRREVEDHQRQLALRAFAAAQRDQARHARGQHRGALAAGVHVLRVVVGAEGAALRAAGARDTGGAGAAAVHGGAGGAVEFGDGDHDGAFHRQQAALGGAPLVDGLELHRVRGQVGHVQAGQDFLGGLRVVVGRAAHQREAGEGQHGVDGAVPVAGEVLLDGGARIEA